jgi:Domain of unknown function (DUF3463)
MMHGHVQTPKSAPSSWSSAGTVREVLDFLNDELRVDQMMISPAYAYWKALDQDHFLGVEQTRELFRHAFAGGRRRRWRLNHSPLFLDFLEGKADFACTARGIPSYSVFGWDPAAAALPASHRGRLPSSARHHRRLRSPWQAADDMPRPRSLK